MQTKIGKTTLCLVTGDIADQDTDAVVTAAHWRLNKGNGTDGTIHTKGGPKIYESATASAVARLVMRSLPQEVISRRGTSSMPLVRFGEAAMKASLNCWRVHIGGVCR